MWNLVKFLKDVGRGIGPLDQTRVALPTRILFWLAVLRTESKIESQAAATIIERFLTSAELL